MAGATLAELRAVTYKKRDSWWTVLLVDPLAIHLVRLADRWRWVTPNRVTLLAFLIGLASAGAFYAGGAAWLIIGAILYHVAFVLDCVDGKLARWQKSGSIIGGWLDFTLDQVRLVICAVALLAGQYMASGDGKLLVMAAVVIFLAMFRYFNGFLMERALFDLRARLDTVGAAQGRAPSISDDDPADQPDEQVVAGADAALRTVPDPTADSRSGPTGASLAEWPAGEPGPAEIPAALPVVSVVPAGDGGRSPIDRLRSWLTARRIRLNVYSGIEFQMAVLIAAPLVGAIAGGGRTADAVFGVTVAACAIMVLFELAQTARFLRSARGLLRSLAVAGAPDGGSGDGEVPVQRPAGAAGGGRAQR